MIPRAETVPAHEEINMFTVSVSRDLYRYEIHSLIKAFYPEEEVRTYVEEPGAAPSFLRVIFSPEEIRLIPFCCSSPKKR